MVVAVLMFGQIKDLLSKPDLNFFFIIIYGNATVVLLCCAA